MHRAVLRGICNLAHGCHELPRVRGRANEAGAASVAATRGAGVRHYLRFCDRTSCSICHEATLEAAPLLLCFG